MPSWLVEDPTIVYLILGTLGLALFAGYWSRRKRGFLYALGVVLLLVGGVWLLDFLVVTEREKLMTSVRAMGARIQALDVDGAFRHISDDYNGTGGNKEQFRQYCKQGLTRFGVTDLKVWDESVVEMSDDQRTARVEFMAKGVGSLGQALWLVRANFFRNDDGQWRLRNFTLHNPAANTNEALPLP